VVAGSPDPATSPPRRPHIAIVDEELPYPPTSGKRLRALNLTLRLAKQFRITFICHRNGDIAEAARARAFFLDQGIRTVVVDRAVPGKSGIGFYARLAGNLLSRLPYTVASHTSGALTRAVRELAASDPVDLWHCEWVPYAETLRRLPEARFVVTAQNIESRLWLRYAQHTWNPLKWAYLRLQMARFLRFERWAFARAMTTVAVSDEDANLAKLAFGAANVEVVDNGVDTAFFQPAETPRDPGRVLFLGSLDWRPNQDAVTQVLDNTWPAVLARHPQATLQIVGRNPPAWLARKVAAVPRVELHASVPDVRPFLQTCGVLAVPLRIGGGSRLKILEALACATPVIATRVGAEGLRLQPGEHLTVVEDCQAMAGALIECLANPELARQQAQHGREVVLRHYDWDTLAERLGRIWRDCVPVLQAVVA
jgi:glycosyltransferase involved in cell wall biosynthesis